MYRTPAGDLYPSVTNVLSILPKPELEAWKASVGPEVAAKSSERSTRYGTLAHARMEDYVDGADPDKFVFDNPRQLITFESLRTAVDGHVDNVVGQEIFLFSNTLRMAGACDLVADWDGVPAVIDYKTSGRHVYPEEVEHYFIQLGSYCAMLYELYGLVRKLLVIVMAVNEEETPHIMVQPVSGQLAARMLEVRGMYKEKYGI